MRYQAALQPERRAALVGLAATGGVITSAGLVLAATFAVLATLPLTFTTQLGIAVALGVLLDTIIVRSVLVTALTLDVGRWMWWPSGLASRPDEPERPAGGLADGVRMPVPRHEADGPSVSPSAARSPGPPAP